ncbi:MAG: 6-phospho-beta-glucosidase [Streptosporangiaceae bacterium]
MPATGRRGETLAILGGGGFRVPLVYRAVLDGQAVDDVVLYDVDDTRLVAICHVLEQMADGRGDAPRVRATTDLDDALGGADFVFSAIRVGGLAERAVDEEVPLAEGIIGQETTGPGGVSYGLRTLPVALRIAERAAEVAPDAWLINFTNPAGMVTEAMAAVLGDRVIGVCDSPAALCRRVAGALDVDPARAWYDYVGLNHLGWLRGVRVGGRDVLPDLLADDRTLASFEEGRLFGGRWLRALGAVPNEYLAYYYFARDALDSMRSRDTTRAAFLRGQQARFYAAVAERPRTALREWAAARREREATYMAESRDASDAGARDISDLEGGGYEGIALALMRAISRGEQATLILNVRNKGAVPALDPDTVVEVPCLVDAGGAHPVATGPTADRFAGLMRSVKAVERATIEAAREGSREAALRALVLHPLVTSVRAAERMLDGYLSRIPALADLLGDDRTAR